MAALFAATYPARTQAPRALRHLRAARRAATTIRGRRRSRNASSTPRRPSRSGASRPNMQRMCPNADARDGRMVATPRPRRGEPGRGPRADRDELADRRPRRAADGPRADARRSTAATTRQVSDRGRPLRRRAHPERPLRRARRASTTCRGSTPTRCSSRSKRSSTELDRTPSRRRGPTIGARAGHDPVHRHRRVDRPERERWATPRWSALLDRHDRIVREVDRDVGRSLGEVHGRRRARGVRDPGPRAARRARAAHDRLAELGIRIRAGVHASEIETRGDDVAGLGVTIAARLLDARRARRDARHRRRCATSSPAPASSSSNAGEHALKGVPGTWSVLHAVAVPEPLAAAAATATTAPDRPAPRQPAAARRSVPRS